MSSTSTTSTESSGTTLRFSSPDEVRAAYARLLEQRFNQVDAPEFLFEVEEFVRRTQAAGAVIDASEDRWACQSMLDYWITVLYAAGRQPDTIALAEFDPMLAPELDDSLSPYMGLEAFRESKHKLFFGRQSLINQLIERLKQRRLIAAVGSSGSGKSSLVIGGLLPILKGGALDHSRTWRYYPTMVPGSDPLVNLARMMKPPGTRDTIWTQNAAQEFLRDPRYLAQLMAQQNGNTPAVIIRLYQDLFIGRPRIQSEAKVV